MAEKSFLRGCAIGLTPRVRCSFSVEAKLSETEAKFFFATKQNRLICPAFFSLQSKTVNKSKGNKTKRRKKAKQTEAMQNQQSKEKS
jgi:hypothetical protein